MAIEAGLDPKGQLVQSRVAVAYVEQPETVQRAAKGND
jgi:hypothetical protein